MTENAEILTIPSVTLSRHRVVALAYDGLCTFEFGVAVEIFGLPRPEMGERWYRFAVAAVDDGELRATGGIRLMTDGGMALLGEADTIVVPGWRGIDSPVQPALCEALVAAHARGCRIISICSGVFVLAAAGLLNGRQATTHWRYTDQLRARFPRIEVIDDVLYVGAEGVMTSAGSAAGIDLCLHLVREDFGVEAANLVARRLVVSPIATAGRRSRLFARWPKRGRARGWGNYLISCTRISPLATPWPRWRKEPAWGIARFYAVSKTPPAKPPPAGCLTSAFSAPRST